MMPDFSGVKEARDFLNTLYFNGQKVTFVQIQGRMWHFDKLSDDEAKHIARSIYFQMFAEPESALAH